MSVELRKELLNVAFADGEHECLIAIVTASPVPRLKRPGHGELRHFLAVSEDSKLRLARQDLFTPKQ